jgi:hypothetical protein
MDFLRECARRLEEDGEDGASVMTDLRTHYETLRCVNVKACLVRSLCRPSDEYVAALDERLRDAPEHVCARARCIADRAAGRATCRESDEVRDVFRGLPPRLPENVRRFAVTRCEARDCRRMGARRTLATNRTRRVVPGTVLLAHARRVLCAPCDTVEGGLPELALCLMLVTGRRECEVLNGRSTFAAEGAHTLRFRGQAKKRDGAVEDGAREERLVPCLAPAAHVVEAVRALRRRQGDVQLANTATSRRYQSSLSRHMRTAVPWCDARATGCTAHSLRGVYTCMCLRLFDWGCMSDAYVSMCILGHSALEESLVYTPYAVDVRDEASLGVGQLTEPPEPVPLPQTS